MRAQFDFLTCSGVKLCNVFEILVSIEVLHVQLHTHCTNSTSFNFFKYVLILPLLFIHKFNILRWLHLFCIYNHLLSGPLNGFVLIVRHCCGTVSPHHCTTVVR